MTAGGVFPPLVEAGVELPPERAARFARHLALPGIGALGQRRIAAARVLVVGAGGLGAPVIQYLAAAGVGRIKIVDDDHVERTNLQRQVLHAEGDVGRPKAESAREAVAALDAAVRVETVVGRLGPDNALALFAAHDLVLDGSDNFATRYLCSDAAELTGTPVVWASILRFAGQLSVFWPGRGPMLRDLFPEIPDEDEALDCATGGVFGALCGVVGSAMAVEALKLVCGVGEPLVGRLARYDALAARWDELRFEADPARAAVTSLAEVAAVCRIPAGSAGRADDISVGEVAARLAADSRGLVVVDVRTADERSAGAIPGSVHVPLETILTGGWAVLAATLGDAATDGRDIVVTCQAGVRSARAIDALRESAPAGSALRNLAGGVAAWR